MNATTNYRRLSCAETAKEIRAALKDRFGKTVRFSVRSDTYSGGASIYVGWTDGPLESEVEAVVGRFANCDFDGMQDMKVYRDETLLAAPDGSLELVTYGANFVFTRRALSPAYEAELIAKATELVRECEGREFHMGTWYYNIMTDFGYAGEVTGYALVRYLAAHIPPAA